MWYMKYISRFSVCFRWARHSHEYNSFLNNSRFQSNFLFIYIFLFEIWNFIANTILRNRILVLDLYKMMEKPLSSIQQTLSWFCVCPFDGSPSCWKRNARLLFTIMILVINVGALASSTVFFYKYLSTNLEGSLYALSIIIAFGGMFYVALIALLMRQKVTAALGSLASICNESKKLPFILWTENSFYAQRTFKLCPLWTKILLQNLFGSNVPKWHSLWERERQSVTENSLELSF